MLFLQRRTEPALINLTLRRSGASLIDCREIMHDYASNAATLTRRDISSMSSEREHPLCVWTVNINVLMLKRVCLCVSNVMNPGLLIQQPPRCRRRPAVIDLFEVSQEEDAC